MLYLMVITPGCGHPRSETDVSFDTLSVGIAAIALAFLAVGFVARLVVGWQRAQAVRRRVAAPAPARLQAGPMVLAGTVEPEAPGGAAITVRIAQLGTRVSRGKSSTWEWRERGRTVDARPFTLVLHGTGERVRVLPGERPLLRARADVTREWATKGTRERTWVATLGRRERARIEGVLAPVPGEGKGYRTSTGPLALQAPEGGRLIVEAESAAYEHDRSAAARRRTVDRLLLFFGLPVAVLLPLVAVASNTDDAPQMEGAFLFAFALLTALLGAVRFFVLCHEKRWCDAERFDTSEPVCDGGSAGSAGCAPEPPGPGPSRNG
jgi:hypothetical protein